MPILKQIHDTIYAGNNQYRLDIVLEKFVILLQKSCNINMTVDELLFVCNGKGYTSSSLDYTFKFGTIVFDWKMYTVEFTFNKDLIDIEHTIPDHMSSLTINVDGDLNLKKARYVRRFTVKDKKDKNQSCDIYFTYDISKKLKMTNKVQYVFEHQLYDCFDLKQLINPCLFLKNKQIFNETLIDFLIQCSTNTDMFYQIFEQYPSVTQNKKSCKIFIDMFIQQYKSNLAALKDVLLTLKMYSI
jgi:hypothetical protein